MSEDIFTRLENRAKEIGARIVFPEGEDDRILRAAAALDKNGIAKPIILGDPAKIESAASACGADISGIPTAFPKESDRLEEMAEAYCAMRSRMKEKIALRLMKKPLFFGAMMVRMCEADGMVGGASCATTSVLQAAGLAIGYEEGVPCPSSVMLMKIPRFLGGGDKFIAFADPAVTVDPSPEELAAIAVQSGCTFRRILGEEPVVALLSFSSKGSAAHAHVDKVKKATELARGMGADFPIDGEFQADAALVPRVAARKIKEESEVAGRANVLVFPDLNSANIAYKLTQYLAGARAIGPILQGFRKPVNDLSRGCTVDDIVQVAILTSVIAGGAH